MNDNYTHGQKQQYDNPNRPGWCAVCRRAFPCPATPTRSEARTLTVTLGKLAR